MDNHLLKEMSIILRIWTNFLDSEERKKEMRKLKEKEYYLYWDSWNGKLEMQEELSLSQEQELKFTMPK